MPTLPVIKPSAVARLRSRVSGRFLFDRKPGLDFSKSVSRTKQSFSKDADINTIMAKYYKTGLLVDPTVVSSRRPMFGDFSDIGDFHALQLRIASVENRFNLLPSVVRNRFKNDPSLLLSFLADPNNDDEAVKLGLRPKAVSPEPDKAKGEPVTAPSPAGGAGGAPK